LDVLAYSQIWNVTSLFFTVKNVVCRWLCKVKDKKQIKKLKKTKCDKLIYIDYKDYFIGLLGMFGYSSLHFDWVVGFWQKQK
jgi:hypothetical protein